MLISCLVVGNERYNKTKLPISTFNLTKIENSEKTIYEFEKDLQYSGNYLRDMPRYVNWYRYKCYKGNNIWE